MNYYDDISSGYDELHKEEQLKKLKIIKQYITPNKDSKLLDVGCGTGVSSLAFDCIVYGIDPSKGLLDIFKSKILNKSNYHISQSPAEKLIFKNNEFDYVISLTAIQNFDDIKKGLQEIRRVGQENFALTFLKRSPQKESIITLIKEIFYDLNIKQIEEAKDIIMIISKIH